MHSATLAIVFVLLAALPAQPESYQWTISASSTDPYVNSSVFAPGVVTVHVWLACSTIGIAAAEFSWEATPGIIPLAFSVCCGWLNPGQGGNCPLLATGGCPSGPIRAGELLLLVNLPGRVCFIDCPDTGHNVSIDCGPNPQVYPNAWIGWSNDGSAPCTAGFCGPVSVEPTGWGRIKGVYR